MASLGVLDDDPINELQPALADGIHLRWAFARQIGFPWHGYYLFRRRARPVPRTCLSQFSSLLQAGAGSNQVVLPIGELSSDRPIALTDDFPPPGVREVDLAARDHLRLTLPPAAPARRAEVTIGFRQPLRCVRFADAAPGATRNPVSIDRVTFVARGPGGARRPQGRVHERGGHLGWDVASSTEIGLPCPATRVELTLFHTAVPPSVTALDAGGNVVATATMSGSGPQTLVLGGRAITRLVISAPQDEALLLAVCFACAGEEDARTGIEVRALFEDVPLAVRRVSGTAGQVVSTVFELDAITRIEMSGGSAALVDLCVVPVTAGLADGWQPIAGFPYPLRLPVAHPDYPPVPPLPGPAEARAVALERISYGPTTPWEGQAFVQLHNVLRRLVDEGPPPGGQVMADRSEDVAGTPPPPEETGGQVTQLRQRPLDLVLLGSLHPAVAQMLGLYWLDSSAAPGLAFDYLLLADHDGSLGGTAASALAWLTGPDWTPVDGFVAFNKRAAPAPALDAPQGVQVFALPGATVAVDSGDELLDATNNAGLVWDRQQTGAVLRPGAPVLYHLWRASLGDVEDPDHPAAGDFVAITTEAPVLVGGRERLGLVAPGGPERPTHWPPFTLDYIDRGRPDGWYAYRMSGIDIFGRHSPTSDDAEWRQWAPMPEPRPWYYLDPPGSQVVDATRIRLLDKLPPPPPTGVEAFALDPDDPTVLRDAAYEAWRESLAPPERDSVIGVRVRWRWTGAQMRQAPDTREFRVYVEPAPVNALTGRVTAVTHAGATESIVDTDISHSHPAHTFDALAIRIGTDSFRILESESSSLRLRVANIGPSDEVRPEDRARCALAIPPDHDLHVEYAEARGWQDRVLVVPFDANVTVEAGGALRRYEVFVPTPGSPDRAGLPLSTSLAEPMAYALVGVTAADDSAHTADHRDDPDRFGNESDVGGPATVFRVRRDRPPPPAVPPDSERLFASPADYHGRSFFTYRWAPAADLRTHVYRALDDAVFAADLALRPRPALSPADASAFPPEPVDPRWDEAKRAQVADELNQLNAFDAGERAAALTVYRALSNDALRVLAALPGTDSAYTQITVQPLDPEEANPAAPDGLRWRRVGPDVAPDTLGPSERAYVDTLDGRATNRWFYRAAYVDGVQNAGPLGLASPPVWLPDVVPPRIPTITRLTAGDRQITIEWASNREPDLAEYRVYRTDDVGASRDVRLMTLVHTVVVEADAPSDRRPTVSWTDDPVPGVRDFWYRIVAVDRARPGSEGGGNVSPPSPAVRARAFDESAPVPPAITVAEWVLVDRAGQVFPWASLNPSSVEREPAVRVNVQVVSHAMARWRGAVWRGEAGPAGVR